jgi:hypothetical protein
MYVDCYISAVSECFVHLQRGKTPIVVGGTAFYLRMFIYGKASGGKATPESVERGKTLLATAQQACAASLGVPLDELPEEDLWNASVDVLLGLGDPESAARCAPMHCVVHLCVLSLVGPAVYR